MTLPGPRTGGRALVTGASGFIGSALCARLLDDGCEVHAVARTAPQAGDRRLRWWAADLTDPSAAAKVVMGARPEIIFHLSGYVDGSRDLAVVLPALQNNLAAAVHLMVASAETGCERFVLAGSMEEPVAGGVDALPPSPYAAAKWAASGYARMFHALYGLPVVTLRIFMVYGPGQRDLRKLIPYVIASLLRGEPPKLSSGRRKVDWIYVDDVVEALTASARAPRVEGTTIDVGSGRLASIREIVEALVDITGTDARPMFDALPERPLEQEPVADLEQAYIRLGWRPRTPLDAGLRATVAWVAGHLERPPAGNL